MKPITNNNIKKTVFLLVLAIALSIG